MKDNKKMQMLENVINFNYGIQVESIQLLREMIAKVYLILSKQKNTFSNDTEKTQKSM